MNRRAMAIGAGAAVVIVLVWYLALWAPRNRTLRKEKERAETAEQARETARTELARLRAAQRDEPANRAKLEVLRAAIPDQPNLAQFILDANDAAIRAGIDFISIAPALPALPTTPVAPAPGATGVGAGAPAPAEIKITIQITGGYFQVLDFVNRLDAMPRLVVTDSLNVSSDPAARLTVNSTVRMFLRSVPPEYGGPAAATAPTTTPGTSPPSSVPAGVTGPTSTPPAGSSDSSTSSASSTVPVQS